MVIHTYSISYQNRVTLSKPFPLSFILAILCVLVLVHVCMYVSRWTGMELADLQLRQQSSLPSPLTRHPGNHLTFRRSEPNHNRRRDLYLSAIIFGPAKIWSSLPHPFRRSSPFILSFPARTGPPLVDSATPRRCPCDEASWHVSGSNAMGCNPSSDMEPG